MSVAFRREGDDEHLEPKFELPIPPGPNLVTMRGLAMIGARVAALEAALPALTEEAAVAAARRDLRYWRTRQATAQPMPVPDGACVAFGCKVGFRMNGQLRQIAIVGDDEADPAAKLDHLARLAFSAPLCRAMMGAGPGEMLEFGGKADAIEILTIEVIAG